MNKILFFDGGMGTMLQSAGALKPGELPERLNLTDPDLIASIHKAYADAGADYITTNTFGANSLKYDNVEEIIGAAVRLAASAGKKVALDIGPTGKLLKPLGELSFEEAYDIFAQMINAGKDGADIVLIETMSDTLELKAAVLAAKENCSLPVFTTMIFDEKSRLLTGADIETAVTMLEGLGVDALGFNCSMGPDQMLPLVKELRKVTSTPIVVNPNAGLPESVNGQTVYNVTPEDFADKMEEIAITGVSYLGGCCGTTPEHIKAMTQRCSKIEASLPEKKTRTCVSSYSRTVRIDKTPVIVGERINPTGKKLMKEALRNGDIDYLVREGMKQKDKGAHILDVNVGLPEIDEPKVMKEAVLTLQGVLDLPLQIDTSDPVAMETALRCYNGKAMINSVNGKEESMKAVFPLAKKYGGVIVCLCLDEKGIPETAEGRIEIAKKIIKTAEEYGIEKHNLVFDALTMTVSTNKDNAKETLKAVKILRDELGVCTTLGVSNISFGLPKRDIINSSFFTLALNAGLSAAIINPLSDAMMNAYYSFNALAGYDENCETYIASVTETAPQPAAAAVTDLKTAVIKGMREDAAACAREMLENTDSMTIINEHIIPALDVVGDGFEKNTIFLPQLLMSADSAKAAFDEIKAKLLMTGKQQKSGHKIVLATVHGDIHDIGKNIVRVLLENYGFDVLDLGKDVPEEDVLKAVVENDVSLVGLSALMTTTVPAMEKTIKLIHENTNAEVIVGGAVLTKSYAKMINADFYAKDAMETVRLAKEHFGI